MALESLFSGNALRAVDAEGMMTLPPFVLRALIRRTGTGRVMFGPHEIDACLTGYDEPYGAWLFAEAERRRLRDEMLGAGPARHHDHMRRTFGAAAPAEVDARGRVRLPAMMRRRAGIGDLALVVGTGGAFEIWDPETARAEGGEALRDLADFALAGRRDPPTFSEAGT